MLRVMGKNTTSVDFLAIQQNATNVLTSLWCQSFGDVSPYYKCLFIILLVRFGLLSGHLLGNSCPLS